MEITHKEKKAILKEQEIWRKEKEECRKEKEREQEDWKRLYDECIYFQIIDARINNTWSEKHPEDQRGWIEFLADLAIKHDDDKSGRFTQEEVERYLEYRKTEWKHLKRPLCC